MKKQGSLKISCLRQMAVKATRNDSSWLRETSFTQSDMECSIKNEGRLIRVDFSKRDDVIEIYVHDKNLSQGVSLIFWSESSIVLHVYFFKQKRSILFWKKPKIRVAKSLNFELVEDDDNEWVQFMWDRTPESF